MNKLLRLKPKVKVHNDFFVWDTETGKRNKDGSIQWHLNARPESFIFGVVYGYNYQREIYSVDEFKEEFKKEQYKGKVVFAHNAEYDLSVVYGNIFDLDPNAIFNGKFICATNGVCLFADSLNIFVGQSVAKIGKLIGIEKPALGNDALFSEKLGPEEINRCATDCRIVWDALIRTFEFAGDIRVTQASLSMTYYRRFHQPYTIEHNDLTKCFWDSYYGGRCEAFKIGKTHSHVIDVNSMYPDAMKNCVFPNPKFFKSIINPPVKHFLKRILPHYEGCIYCEVFHKETKIGYLPIKKDGKLLFPVGTFTGCWNFNELEYAINSGVVTIKTISKVIYAERMESPFKSFVDKLYLEKVTSKIQGDYFTEDKVKRFMNSLYGKFAQRITEENLYIRDINKQWDLVQEHQRKGTFIKLQFFNKDRVDCFLVVKPTKNIDKSFSIPSFASYITSYGRVKLLQQLIKMENNSPVYCDTDSIFYEINDGSIISSNELGAWKIEEKIVTEIRGLKNYKYIDNGVEKHKLKGVPSKAIKIAENIYEYENLLKTKEALRRNKDNGVLTKRVKQIKGKYNKRIVLADGETKPIKL